MIGIGADRGSGERVVFDLFEAVEEELRGEVEPDGAQGGHFTVYVVAALSPRSEREISLEDGALPDDIREFFSFVHRLSLCVCRVIERRRQFEEIMTPTEIWRKPAVLSPV